MRRCGYFYCRHEYDDPESDCPLCGYPPGEPPKSTEAVKARVRALAVDRLIDMHQILPNVPGIEALQLDLMDALGIERVLLQSVPNRMETLLGNSDLRALQLRHPKRVWASAFLDPRHPRACRRLRDYAKEGIRVIKLLPCLGYHPGSRRWRRFWRTMESLELVAMVHTGFITARHKKEEQRAGVFLDSNLCQPILFDRLARQYPGIQFILCHLGGTLWFEQAAEMVYQHENVWGDVSGSGLLALDRIVKNQVALDWTKVFWGNDDVPWHYPYSLNLLHHHLGTSLPSHLPALLVENARRFIARHFEREPNGAVRS